MTTLHRELIETIALHWPAHNGLARTCKRMAEWASTCKAAFADANLTLRQPPNRPTGRYCSAWFLPNGRVHGVATLPRFDMTYAFGALMSCGGGVCHELEDGLLTYTITHQIIVLRAIVQDRTRAEKSWKNVACYQLVGSRVLKLLDCVGLGDIEADAPAWPAQSPVDWVALETFARWMINRAPVDYTAEKPAMTNVIYSNTHDIMQLPWVGWTTITGLRLGEMEAHVASLHGRRHP